MVDDEHPASLTVEVTFTGITHGGEAVGRLPDGIVCFVPAAIPGERARVRITERRRRWARGELVELLERSSDRVDPPCPYYGRCGGCQLQHVRPERQAQLKRRIVVEQLERLGGLDHPPVTDLALPGGSNWHRGYRTSARFAVDSEGRLGFHRSSSDEVVPINRCLLLTPQAQALREAAGDGWRGVAEVAIRVGCSSGDQAITVTPGEDGVPPLPPGDVPVALVGLGTPVAFRGEPAVIEHVAGIPFRVSAGSFFQPGPAGAEALIALVREAAAIGEGDLVLDLYAGIGLFARALGDEGAQVVAVESARPACEDACVNLEPLGEHAEVVRGRVERVVTRMAAEHRHVDVIVLDPPRRGAGTVVCATLARLTPRTIIYVACDPAALARDARALTDAGYHLVHAVPVDQFGNTAQIETVATFRPS